MLKDKLNKLFNTKGDNKKKIENLIFLLVVLVITIIAINSIWSNDKKEKTNSDSNNKKLARIENNESSSIDNEESLEIKLENILSKISGVGKVDVMLNFTESTQIIPVYNKKEKISDTEESDSGGGKRQVKESDVSQDVVYQEQNGKNIIATQKTVNPKIEGAIITAEGAGNSSVKANIIQAVEAVTGLATHKIQVFEKQV